MSRRHFLRNWSRVPISVIAVSFLFSLSTTSIVSSQEVATDDSDKVVRALRINPHAPTLDGKLDDEIWEKADFVSGFRQREPDEGEPAKDETEIAFVFDDEALYIGARMRKFQNADIVSTMSRRDNPGNSERVIVSMDTYHDRRTAYTFAITASGVRVDYYHASDSETDRDYDFNPVWEARAARSSDGWSAEMRIPFSQLRFQNKDTQTWGVNINRWSPNLNEDSYWIQIPKDENGWSSKMGSLVGLQDIRPSKRGEFLPYAASDLTMSDGEPYDPFHSSQDLDGRFGGDLKIGVGPNLTLDATINPDFGQVEADPAQVNLSAFEIFFDERRPFFLEGRQLFDSRDFGYFYSRRIGAPPSGDPGRTFNDIPANTSILGAAKLTGRLNSGLSVGLLTALTQKEKASFREVSEWDSEDRPIAFTDGEEDVEPAAGWGVVRLQQEFGRDASTVGVIATAVERDTKTGENIAYTLADRAYAGGLEWNLRFNGGKYEISGATGGSYVEGSKEAMADVQQSSARNFQRPDADYVNFDPNRTSLSGFAASLALEKNSGKHWLWEVGGRTRSPGFEINDAGRMNTADDIDSWAQLEYRENDPSFILNSYNLWFTLGSGWNYGYDRQYSYADFETRWEFKNFMGMWMGGEYYPRAQSDNLTRGGPSMGKGKEWNLGASLWSSQSGKTTWDTWTGMWNGELGGGGWWLGASVTFRPGSRWELRLNPAWDKWTTDRQYAAEVPGGPDETFGTRYIFAFADRSALRLQTRLNYAFTPNLTLELYAEPYASSGRFYNFGELTAARSRDVRQYDSVTYNPDTDEYTAQDGNETVAFSADFGSDFNYISFRSNVVVRWEWMPGSTMFLIWQQNRSGDEPYGDTVTAGRLFDSFSAEGENFFALKITYWIPFL